MYCTNCGYHLKEAEKKKALKNNEKLERDLNTRDYFVCPRCGKIIKDDLSEDEIKSLSMASHAEIHKSNNKLNTGKAFLVIGSILLCIGILFLILCFKPNNQNKFAVNCTEFYVFIAISAISLFLLVSAVVFLVKGKKTKKEYLELLKDIQNRVFIQ